MYNSQRYQRRKRKEKIRNFLKVDVVRSKTRQSDDKYHTCQLKCRNSSLASCPLNKITHWSSRNSLTSSLQATREVNAEKFHESMHRKVWGHQNNCLEPNISTSLLSLFRCIQQSEPPRRKVFILKQPRRTNHRRWLVALPSLAAPNEGRGKRPMREGQDAILPMQGGRMAWVDPAEQGWMLGLPFEGKHNRDMASINGCLARAHLRTLTIYFPSTTRRSTTIITGIDRT